MTTHERIRCRMAACREKLAGDDHSWSFYLINDNLLPVEVATLWRVSWEFGDIPRSEDVAVQVGGLAPGAAVRLWRDDGELRMELRVSVCLAGREAQLSFEFPRVFRPRVWPVVDVLGKPGLEVVAET